MSRALRRRNTPELRERLVALTYRHTRPFGSELNAGRTEVVECPPELEIIKMLTLQSTLGCPSMRRIVFAMEEMGLEYALDPKSDGYFLAEHRRPGPSLLDGGDPLFEVGAILRHLARRAGSHSATPANVLEAAQVDSWLDVSTIRIAMPWSVKHESLSIGLEAVERRMATREWLLDRFTLADCAMSILITMRAAGALETWPVTAQYAGRIAQRPAWSRMQRIVSDRTAWWQFV